MDEPASSFLLLLGAEPLAEAPNFTAIALKLTAVLLLVLANGFFVGSEFALVSVRRQRLEARAAAGNKGAKAALRLLHSPTTFISAVQLGVTLASLALGWLGEPTVEAALEPLVHRFTQDGTRAYLIAHGLAVALAFLAITFLHIVLGELVPKMMALERAERLALVVARPLELFAYALAPPIWVFNKAGSALGRLLGLKSTLEHAAVYTEEELRQLIDISKEKGHLRREEQRLIHRVFEFSDTQVREAMVPRTEVAAIPETYTLEQIAAAFKEHGYSRLPVYRDSLDDVTGFVHSKDVMPYLLKPKTFKLKDVLKSALFVVDTARLEDVLRQMQREKFHFAFVVDEHGGVEGVLTLEDLLEEIVGDISDDHDEEVNEQIAETADGTFHLDGGLALRDLNRRLQLELPESEAYTTIAGFLMDTAGQVLAEGEMVEYNGLKFHVEEVERRRIRRVRLEKPIEETAAEIAGAA